MAASARCPNNGNEPLHSLTRHRRRQHLVDPGRGFRPWPGGVYEGVRTVKITFRCYFEGLLEIGLGLAWKTDDDVGGDGQLGHCFTSRGQAFEVSLSCVSAMHPSEDPVAPGLQRKVQVFADVFAFGHRFDGFEAQILGVRRGIPNSTDSGDIVDRPQQVCETWRVLASAEVAAVRVDVLTQEGDFGHSIAGELADFGNDVAHAAGDLTPTYLRHDAEGATVVTADLNRHPRRKR